MAHLRKQIRERVVTELADLVTTKKNVFESRFYNLNADVLPAIRVYTNNENSELDTLTRPRKLSRELEIIIESVVKQNSKADDTLDTSIKEIEEALGASLLNNLVKDFYLTNIEILQESDQENPVIVARMTYNCMYRVSETDVESGV